MIDIGSSVIKRYDAPASQVRAMLAAGGFQETGSAMNGKVKFHQNSGINLTTVDGPLATLVMPSGPVRGSLFGDEAVGIRRRQEGSALATVSEEDMVESRARDNQFSV